MSDYDPPSGRHPDAIGVRSDGRLVHEREEAGDMSDLAAARDERMRVLCEALWRVVNATTFEDPINVMAREALGMEWIKRRLAADEEPKP